MARPKPDFPPAEAILALCDGEGRLALRVTPGAKVEGIEIAAGRLTLKTRAKPKDGEANDAVVAMLGKALGRAPSRIRLIRGETGREKMVQIQ
ncbi:DUF167 domain-containing protein [Altericroceibacterium spongiae]|uniref:UPF0235 protein D6851_13730 n=1 Tax=Altericroceibacterium spongiae TaxID=2320269 RepID=A0A420EEI5_9SPHN|nr:DUF167 domain-containing protein [Altericroceibacterium spongiae]RKF19072.1 DUF167 domain-containing protein [Altericroceibacterium spongiae]